MGTKYTMLVDFVGNETAITVTEEGKE